MEKNKVLIIRFSSFGDIVQCASVVESIRQRYPSAVIHWVTRSDFAHLVKLNRNISHVWSLDKKNGFMGLLSLIFKLRNENYDFIYDAHNNLRSSLIEIFLRFRILRRPLWITRSKDRIKRICLFMFRKNYFPKPFKGIVSYHQPLAEWGVKLSSNAKLVDWKFDEEILSQVRSHMKPNTIVLVPSAAWEMKRWPISSWKDLIGLMDSTHFILLGGKEDIFCEDLRAVAPERVLNLAGKLSLVESCALISQAKIVISADTGLLHVSDVLGVKALSLMGPTAFGFTVGNQIKTLEIDLTCRPCSKDGRGKCTQSVYQRCMVEISPFKVADEARRLMK